MRRGEGKRRQTPPASAARGKGEGRKRPRPSPTVKLQPGRGPPRTRVCWVAPGPAWGLLETPCPWLPAGTGSQEEGDPLCFGIHGPRPELRQSARSALQKGTA